jgi:peroxiredoxin
MSISPAHVSDPLRRVREHRFAEIQDGFTIDPRAKEHGVADPADDAWRVRLLALRDLVRLGPDAARELTGSLSDATPHVRQVVAMALGILGSPTSEGALQERLAEDPDTIVRAQAAVSLGELGLPESMARLALQLDREPSRDVVHRIQLAMNRIEYGTPSDDAVAGAYAALDESTFRTAVVGRPALDFELRDTDDRRWRLSAFRGRPTVLIWIFADWCPVCHHEFHDLIELRSEFEAHGVNVVTIECHDRYRCRVMTGQAPSPSHRGYRFADAPPQEQYRQRIWWPHLLDPAGAVGATYGVDPLEFVVHAEWVNRPSTFIIDADGVLRFAYVGTFWGDRPSIGETLEIAISGRYEFEHPKRLPQPSRTGEAPA